MIDAAFEYWEAGLPCLSRLAGQPLEGLPPLALATALEDLPTEALRSVDAGEAEYAVAALQRAINVLTAAQAVLLDTFATRVEEEAEQRGVRWGSGSRCGDAASALAPLLHVAPLTMAHRLEQARTLVAELPVTLELAREGHLEPWRVTAIATEAGCLQPGLGPTFDQALHAREDVLHLPAARLRARAARTAVQVDPHSAMLRAREAKRGRHVRVSPGEDPGMTRWNAYHPVDSSAAAWAAIDELAQEYSAADPDRGIEAARSDAMIDLILQRATVQTTVTLAVPTEPTGPCEHGVSGVLLPSGGDPANEAHPGSWNAGAATPALIGSDLCTLVSAGRTGWLLADTVAALLQHPSTTVRLATVEPAWSAIHTLHQPSYRPRAALDRAVRERDGTCRFPGCATPAHRCDLDHVRPYPDGRTTAANLLTLCRRHHRFKHHANWTVTVSPEGEAIWTSPTGRTHATQPRSIHDLVA